MSSVVPVVAGVAAVGIVVGGPAMGAGFLYRLYAQFQKQIADCGCGQEMRNCNEMQCSWINTKSNWTLFFAICVTLFVVAEIMFLGWACYIGCQRSPQEEGKKLIERGAVQAQ